MDTNNQNIQSDEIEIDLLELMQVLLAKIWLILLTGLFVGGVAYVFSKFVISPTFESTTKIYILNKQDSTNVTYSDVQLGTQLTKDYAELISSRYVLEEVVQKLGLDLSYKEMKDKVSVTTPSDTRIVAITVSDGDPVLAMNMANAVRETASTHIQNVMDIEAVNIVETANMPTEKASPSCSKWALIGFVLGAFVICAIEIVRHLLDDTIKTSEDVERYLNLSTLALIPVSDDADDTKGTKKKKKKEKRKEI